MDATMDELLKKGLVKSSGIEVEAPPGTNMARELLAAFRRHARRTLLVDAGSGREYTGAQLLGRVGRVATSLVNRLGVKTGDVVMMLCEHTDVEIMFALSAVLAGASVYGCNSEDSYEDNKTMSQIVRPDLIATTSKLHSQLAGRLKAEVEGLADVPVVWVDSLLETTTTTTTTTTTSHTDNGVQQLSNGIHHDDKCILDANNNEPSGGGQSIVELKQLLASDKTIHLVDELLDGPLDERLLDEICQERIKPQEHALTYMLTSGTTGHPKVVVSTHEELIYGMYAMVAANKSHHKQDQVKQQQTNQPHTQELDPEALMPVNANSILAGDLPLDHGAGVNTMFLSLVNGSKFVVMPSYDVDIFWQYVQDYRITASIASTTFAYKLLCRLKELIQLGQTQRWDLSHFRFITCCGSKMAFVELVREVNKVYDHIAVCQCYGATEIGFMSMLSIADCRTHLHSVGRLFPGVHAKVVNDQGQQVEASGEKGELHVWSKSKFKGYRCHPEDNPEELFARCHDQQRLFYKTGDLAHFDSDGRLYIHGRIKDTLYLMQDWKIMPAELEELVNQHPLVEFSVVIGVPDKDLAGCDAPKAFVKLISSQSKEFQELESAELKRRLVSQDREFIARDVYQFVAERTAEPKHLKGGVRVVDKFPYVGLLNKVDRKALSLID